MYERNIHAYIRNIYMCNYNYIYIICTVYITGKPCKIVRPIPRKYLNVSKICTSKTQEKQNHTCPYRGREMYILKRGRGPQHIIQLLLIVYISSAFVRSLRTQNDAALFTSHHLPTFGSTYCLQASKLPAGYHLCIQENGSIPPYESRLTMVTQERDPEVSVKIGAKPVPGLELRSLLLRH